MEFPAAQHAPSLARIRSSQSDANDTFTPYDVPECSFLSPQLSPFPLIFAARLMPQYPSSQAQAPGFWKESSIETNEGFQSALLFDHPAREIGFPDFYLLPEPHPLRPPGFVPDHRSQTSFNDYVVAVRKDLDFMKGWQAVGAKTATPTNNVSLNLEEGVCPYDHHSV